MGPQQCRMQIIFFYYFSFDGVTIQDGKINLFVETHLSLYRAHFRNLKTNITYIHT